MNPIKAIAGSLVGGIWKLAAIGLAVCLAASSAYLGANWWLAERDLKSSKVELTAERDLSSKYRDAIGEQNRAVDALAAQKAGADERGRAAQQLAAANGRRLDLALAKSADARATTCTEAMPVVNATLEAVR